MRLRRRARQDSGRCSTHDLPGSEAAQNPDEDDDGDEAGMWTKLKRKVGAG